MIPALAFNDTMATILDNVRLLGDHLEAVVPKVKEFSHFNKEGTFQSKTSAIAINRLVINVASHNGLYIERENTQNFDLVIPIEGYVKAKIDGVSYDIAGGHNALISSSHRHKSVSVGSNIIIRLDQQKLDATCASMNGVDSEPSLWAGNSALQLKLKDISFLKLFQTLLNQIDIFGGNPKLLEKLAFDDRVYRLSAGLVYPNLLLSGEPVSGRRPQVSTEIDMLCEYLSANLRQPISLTQMEQMSELSARKLQYAFRKAFGMGARDWLRQQRLHAARSALLNTHEHTTIAFVAYDFCFISASEFSRHYQKEFGELPEQTLKRGRY